MSTFINVTGKNKEAVQEWIKLGILKSYDLQGSRGRQIHDSRLVKIRRTTTGITRELAIREEEKLSRIVPYS
jgi:hypothetical protein